MMTAQEIFNTVVAHLRKQGRQAEVSNGCRYRTSDGLKCAVGCLIPDELYQKKFEGKTIYASELQPVLNYLGIEPYGQTFRLLAALQMAHDHWRLEDLPVIAKTHGLTYDPNS